MVAIPGLESAENWEFSDRDPTAARRSFAARLQPPAGGAIHGAIEEAVLSLLDNAPEPAAEAA